MHTTAQLKAIDGYWYLGTPYSKFPGGIDAGWRAACRLAARLVTLGIPVFSPIAHTHPIAHLGGLDPLDHALWLPADGPLMAGAHGLLVGTLASWADSFGLGHEVEVFTKAGKPVLYLEPQRLVASASVPE